MEFGEWLCQEVVKAVPHRHFVVSIPKMLRRYFLYDRKLLSDLSRVAWDSLKMFFQESVPESDAVPGAVIAIQTFGDFLGFNPHCHILITDGSFYGTGMFRLAPTFERKDLEAIFQHKVLKMLLSKGKIRQDLIDMLMTWRHSGFNVFCGPRIYPRQEEALENIARYIIRASFSQERMTYVPEEAKVMYESKDRKQEKVFDALEWLAAMLARRSHAKTGDLTYQTRANRLSVPMDITGTWVGAGGTGVTRMNVNHLVWIRRNHQNRTERIGLV